MADPPTEKDFKKDEAALQYEKSAEFWRMIEVSRRQPTRPLREVEAELFAEGE